MPGKMKQKPRKAQAANKKPKPASNEAKYKTVIARTTSSGKRK